MTMTIPVTVLRQARAVVTTKYADGDDKSSLDHDAVSVLRQWSRNMISNFRITDFKNGHRKLSIVKPE